METNKEKQIEREINWIIGNWKIIPDKFKSNLKPNQYNANVKDLSLEEHFVVLLLDRQKPSVIPDYSFDKERIGITREGKVVWGFDSGCSCIRFVIHKLKCLPHAGNLNDDFCLNMKLLQVSQRNQPVGYYFFLFG